MSGAAEQFSNVDMGVFVNEYTHNMDAKKRLTIPSDWRELIGAQGRIFIMRSVTDPCLMAFRATEANRRLQESIMKLSITDRRSRQVARKIGAESDMVPWDSQGRIRIKDSLMEFAELGSEVMLVGTLDGFELWNPEKYKLVSEDPEGPSLGDAAEYVGF